MSLWPLGLNFPEWPALYFVVGGQPPNCGSTLSLLKTGSHSHTATNLLPLQILAPPKGFLLQSKTERQNAATEAAYKEEYINRLKEVSFPFFSASCKKLCQDSHRVPKHLQTVSDYKWGPRPKKNGADNGAPIAITGAQLSQYHITGNWGGYKDWAAKP